MTCPLKISTPYSAFLWLVLACASLDAAALTVVSGEYKLPAALDSTVTTSLPTELWARVWRPTTPGPYPLIVFLHGNHATCGRFDAGLGVRVDDRIDYTTTGTCPPGYVVAPSHAGYHYLAEPLASYGYVVVSINANRGVNAAPGVSGDAGLNLRRGRLVLRHLQQLAQWNNGVGSPPASLGFSLTGLLDFTNVGLMGHSRGGEGMRAAKAQYEDAGSAWPARIGPVTFKSLFEIGPVDGQTSRILNAASVHWNVVLPGCDGDVADLQGVKPFDRMLQITNEAAARKKSTFQVFGANHNFYNTEWQLSDAGSCLGQTPIFPQLSGSSAQRTTALQTLVPFFRATVGTAPLAGLANRFDPSYPLPASLTSITAYARGFTPTPRAGSNFVIDNFEKATGVSSRNIANQFSGLAAYSHGGAGSSHDATQRVALINWNAPGGFLQVNAAATGAGFDVSTFRSLEFRVMLRCSGSICSSPPAATGDVDFSVALANADGTRSAPLTLKSRAVVRRPAGSFLNNTVLQTVRIPLTSFAGATLASLRGVRFTFDRTASSAISLGNVRLTRTLAADTVLPATAQTAADATWSATPTMGVQNVDDGPEANEIVAIRVLGAGARSVKGLSSGAVEIQLASTRPFPVGGALPILSIGGQDFAMSRYATGATDQLVFVLDEPAFDALPDQSPVTVRIGAARQWEFGHLNKAQTTQAP